MALANVAASPAILSAISLSKLACVACLILRIASNLKFEALTPKASTTNSTEFTAAPESLWKAVVNTLSVDAKGPDSANRDNSNLGRSVLTLGSSPK